MILSEKLKRCRYCKTKHPESEMVRVQLSWFCDYDHAAKFAAEKVKANQEKEIKAKIAKMKEGNKSYRKKLSEAQEIFNELRRLQEFKWFRDRGLKPTCISCGKELGGDQWCAGHLKTAGHHTNTRFDPLNVWLQHNRRCNMALSGDLENYKIGLIKRFGEKEGLRIIEHCETESKKERRYTDEELSQMKKEWREEIKKLKKELQS